jgi:hypothetical protein
MDHARRANLKASGAAPEAFHNVMRYFFKIVWI